MTTRCMTCHKAITTSLVFRHNSARALLDAEPSAFGFRRGQSCGAVGWGVSDNVRVDGDSAHRCLVTHANRATNRDVTW
jgi:hypothetical protein